MIGSRRRTRLAVMLAVLLWGWYMAWSTVRLHGPTNLVRGYHYWRTDAGIVIRCLYDDRGGGDAATRMSRQEERDRRDFGEFQGVPQAGPDVDGYRVYRDAIVGHVSRARVRNSYGDPLPKREPRPEGYFIIDVRIDRVHDGLSKQEWLSKLRAFGLRREPVLHRPSIFDGILRRNRP